MQFASWRNVVPKGEAMTAKLPRDNYRHGDLKRALLDAGIELARAGGPEAIVLREATRRAGVVPNAAYRHFASRDDLLEAVRSAALAELARSMEAEIAAAEVSDHSSGLPAVDRARARLRAVGAGYLRFACRQTGLFKTAFTAATRVEERDPDPERAGHSGLTPFQLLSSSLDDLERCGVLSAERRPGAEYLAWSAVHGMAMLAIDGPLMRLGPEDLEGLGQALLSMVECGLTAPAAA